MKAQSDVVRAIRNPMKTPGYWNGLMSFGNWCVNTWHTVYDNWQPFAYGLLALFLVTSVVPPLAALLGIVWIAAKVALALAPYLLPVMLVVTIGIIAWERQAAERTKRAHVCWITARRIWAFSILVAIAFGFMFFTGTSILFLGGLAAAAVGLIVYARVPAERIYENPLTRHAAIQAGMIRAGIFSEGSSPTLNFLGAPSTNEYGTTRHVVLPGKHYKTVVNRRDELAAAFGVPEHKLTVTHRPEHPADTVTLWIGSEKNQPVSEASVVREHIADFSQPIDIGNDVAGRPHFYRTKGCHTAIVGTTGSGKTWLGRIPVAEALLDPTTMIFASIGKDDIDDWQPMAPLCEMYVGGVSKESIAKVEQMLLRVERLSESRANAGRNAPFVVLIVDEWYRTRLAAQRIDKDMAKRIESLYGELLATTRSRNIHIITVAQRGTTDYIQAAEKANMAQRLVGVTASDAEVRYVLDRIPDIFPKSSGQFLISTDDKAPTLITVPPFDDEAFKAVCRKAKAIRAEQDLSDDLDSPPVPVSFEKELPKPQETALAREVGKLLVDGPLTTTEILHRLPGDVAPSNPITLGRMLRDIERTTGAVMKGRRDKDPAWHLAKQLSSVGG